MSASGGVRRVDPGLALAAALGVLLFFAITGGGILDPRHAEWLLREQDPATGFLGWQFFRQAPLVQFPFGANPGYGMEMGSSVVYTDSIPLLAFLFKPFSAWLPAAFQYWGFWILACFVLQCLFGYCLLRRFSAARWLALAGSAFFGLAPPAMARLAGHFALFGQWLLVAGLCLYFAPRWSPRRWTLLLATAALVHFYLWFMVAALWAADLWQRRWRREAAWPQLAGHGLAAASLVFVLFWAAGYFMLDGYYGGNGFGVLRMNLLALIDPDDDWSFVLPDVPNTEWEGFNYLGSGLLVLLLPAAVALLRRRIAIDRRAAVPLAAACLGLTLLALSDRVAAGTTALFSYELPQFVVPLLGLLRSSGRMFWPVYYVIVLAILVGVSRAVAPRAALLVCLGALVIQVADGAVGLQRFRAQYVESLAWSSPMRSPLWDTLGARYKRVTYVLPHNAPDDFVAWARFAQAHGMALNTGYFARVDEDRLGDARQLLLRSVIAHIFDPESLYVFEDRRLWQLALAGVRPVDVAGVLDGFRVFAPRLAACTPCDLRALDDVRPDRPGRYWLGERVSFINGGTAHEHALRGWSHSEPWGTWSEGSLAVLAFDLAEPPRGDLSLELEGRAYVNRRHPQQRVDIAVNGIPVHSLLYLRPQATELRRVRIPRSVLAGRQHVEVQLLFRNPISPHELGLGADARRLGLGLVSMRLQAVPRDSLEAQRRAGS